MGLKTILDNLDDVQETARDFYKQEGDKFILDLEGIDSHPAVVNLKNAHERTKADRKKFLDELTGFRQRFDGLPEDFSAEEFERIRAAAEGKEPPKADEQVARVREQLEKKHAKELAERDALINSEKSLNMRLLVDDGLTKALVEAGVGKEYLRASKALLRDMVKVIDEDGERKAIVETDMGPSPLSKFVSDWTASDEGKPFVSKATGGGATGGNGRSNEPNPWHKDSRNMTEQGRIWKQDRAKAERLMRAAGMSEADIRKRTNG